MQTKISFIKKTYAFVYLSKVIWKETRWLTAVASGKSAGQGARGKGSLASETFTLLIFQS